LALLRPGKGQDGPDVEAIELVEGLEDRPFVAAGRDFEIALIIVIGEDEVGLRILEQPGQVLSARGRFFGLRAMGGSQSRDKSQRKRDRNGDGGENERPKSPRTSFNLDPVVLY